MAYLYVVIYYGPCATFHARKHKPQRLYGLRDRLRNLGFRVDIVPVSYINYCVIEMCGYEVFRCNITNLQFNTSHERDPVCQRAIDAVVKSSTKFQRARAYSWLWNLIEQGLFRTGPYAPKNYWPVDVDIEPYTLPNDCDFCCNKHIRKRDEQSLIGKI